METRHLTIVIAGAHSAKTHPSETDSTTHAPQQVNLSQVSVNLFSLRDRITTPEDFARGIERLAKIGFKSVQLSGVPSDLMPESEFVRICSENGISITATHEPSDRLLDDPRWSIDRLKKLGVTDTAYPFPKDIDFTDADKVDAWIKRLDEVANIMSEAGITLCYHNHHREFTRVRGKLVYERIFEETRLHGEPDTYWVQLGGANPLHWVERWAAAGRLPLIHLKDVCITASGETRFGELGSGTLDFDPIIAAAAAGNCRSYIIEQDQTYERDPFEAIAESFHFLNTHYLT